MTDEIVKVFTKYDYPIPLTLRAVEFGNVRARPLTEDSDMLGILPAIPIDFRATTFQVGLEGVKFVHYKPKE